MLDQWIPKLLGLSSYSIVFFNFMELFIGIQVHKEYSGAFLNRPKNRVQHEECCNEDWVAQNIYILRLYHKKKHLSQPF